MTKSPAFQFYPGDWRRDTALQTCSLRARGLWAEMLWLMHDGLPYGHLATLDGEMSLKTLTRLVHAPLGVVTRDLAELERHGVFSRTEDGVIYSRRMVRDLHIRLARAEYGRLGAASGHLGKDYGALGGRPKKTPLNGGIENPVDGGIRKPPPASASASAKETRRADWTASLPWPAIPSTWWTTTLALFPGIDHESVCRDAAAYWLEHPGKYRDPKRYLRHQLARAFARRTVDPMVGVMPMTWQCGQCGEIHEGKYGDAEVCPT